MEASNAEEMLDEPNSVRRKQLKFVITLLDLNFENGLFGITEVVRQAQLRSHNYLRIHGEDFCRQLNSDISMFVWLLARAAGCWAEMLLDETIVAEDNIVDLYVFTSKVYTRFIRTGATVCSSTPQLAQLVSSELYMFLEKMSDRVCTCYNIGKKLVTEQIDELNGECSNFRLANKFIIYKLLRELHRSMHQRISDCLKQSVFANVDPETVEEFAKYIIETHDVMKIVNGTSQHELKEMKSLEDQFVEKLKLYGKNAKSVSCRKATREDGKQALCIEMEELSEQEATKEPKATTYLVQINNDEEEVLFLDAGLSRKKWVFSESRETSIESLLVKKNKLVESMRGAPTTGQQLNMLRGMQTVGGSLGSCLANIGNYDSVGSFITDFSRKALISSSLNIMISRIPLFGYFLILGGFSLSFYNIFQNPIKSKKKKLRDVGNMLLGTTSSIGSGIVGGIFGSAFIPIPVLGLFIGSLVGGLVGGVTGNAFTSFLESNNFMNMIDSLEELIELEGYWKSTPKLLGVLGFDKEEFYHTIPHQLEGRMNCDHHWLTMLCFCMLSFSQAKKHTELINRLMKIYDPKIHEQLELPVSPILEKSLQFLEKERLDLRKYLWQIEQTLKQIFQAA